MAKARARLARKVLTQVQVSGGQARRRISSDAESIAFGGHDGRGDHWEQGTALLNFFVLPPACRRLVNSPNQCLRLSGTLPPPSATFAMTCLCSQTFMAAEPSNAPV
jgi:hypothetical protein